MQIAAEVSGINRVVGLVQRELSSSSTVFPLAIDIWSNIRVLIEDRILGASLNVVRFAVPSNEIHNLWQESRTKAREL